MLGRATFEYDRQTATPNGQAIGFFAIGTLVAAGLAIVWLTDELRINPLHIALTSLLFSVRLVVLDRPLYASGKVYEPRLAPLRAAGNLSTLLVTSAYAAPSALEVPPTWTMTLICAVILGTTMARPAWEWVVLIFVGTVGYHVVAAPQVTVTSFSVAVAVAALASAIAMVVNTQTRQTRTSARAAEASSSLAQAARDEAHGLAASMALHDGLSGLVFVTRTRLQRIESLEEAVRCTAPLVEQGRILLGESAETAAQLSARIRSQVRDVPTVCRVDGAFDSLDPLERLDLRFIVLEQVANALKHRVAERLEVEVTAGRRRSAKTVCIGAPRASRELAGAGRHGLVNGSLRARSWRGESGLEVTPQSSVAWAEWSESSWRVQRLSLVGLLVATLLPLAWLGHSSLVVVLFAGLAGVTTAFAQVVAFAQVRAGQRAEAASRELRVATELFREEHAAALRAAVARIGQAQTESPQSLRAAVDALASCVTLTMKALSAPPRAPKSV